MDAKSITKKILTDRLSELGSDLPKFMEWLFGEIDKLDDAEVAGLGALVKDYVNEKSAKLQEELDGQDALEKQDVEDAGQRKADNLARLNGELSIYNVIKGI